MPSLLLALTLAVPTAHAQGADMDWQTLETEHFRLHTPVEALPWATHVAGRLEEIRARVSAEVGPAPRSVVDIVVMDPARTPNGFAITLLRHPRMGIFPTAPGANSGLASFRSWDEDLVVHEDAHLVHLLRESRSPVWNSTLALLGAGPLATSPGWVIEGYATVVEGRLTGSGRPHGDLRAAWLRILAQDGQLPAYQQLDGGEAWMSRSHRYLLGSAYLEWLEGQRCTSPADVPAPGACAALPDLWARMSARKLRGFAESFEGVFGDAPDVLYGQFTAELTAAAMAQGEVRPESETLWLDLDQTTAEPALSADGSQLVAVRMVNDEASLVVWDTADDPEALENWLAPHKAAQERDPEDVLPVVPDPLPRAAFAERHDPLRPARHPRFLPDSTVLMSVWERDRRGQLRPDLFTWDPTRGRERRITRNADLTWADPLPDGSAAIALRRRWGQDELVKVDLSTGEVTVLSAPDVPVVLDRPRVDPAGDQVAYLRHDGQWRLVIHDLATGVEWLPALPPGVNIADPAWLPDGKHVVASLGQAGFIDLYALDLDAGQWHPLTASRGAAFAAAPTPDGEAIYHLGLGSRGIGLHRVPVDLTRQAVPIPDAPPPVRPPIHPDPPEALTSDPASVTARPYQLGRTEWMPLAGGGAGPGGGSGEVGLRLGDIIGRHEVLFLGAWNSPSDEAIGTPNADVGDVSGAALRTAWRGPPVAPGGAVHLDGWWLDHGPLGARRGVQLDIGARQSGPTSAWSWQAGGWADGPVLQDGRDADAAGFVGVAGAQRFFHDAWVEPRGAVDLQLGLDGPLIAAQVGLGAGVGSWHLSGTWTRAGAATRFRIGGLSSSLLPDAATAAWVPTPWLPPDHLRGSWRTALDIELGSDGLGLFYGREQLDDGPLAGTRGAVGLRTRGQAMPVPLVRLPAVALDTGVACVLEVDDDVDPARCKDLSGWAAWLSARWGW